MSKILKLFPKGAEKRIDHPHTGRKVHVPTQNNRRYVWATVQEQHGDLLKVSCGQMLPWWVSVDVVRDAKPELHKPVVIMKHQKQNHLARLLALALLLLLPSAFGATEAIQIPTVFEPAEVTTDLAYHGTNPPIQMPLAASGQDLFEHIRPPRSVTFRTNDIYSITNSDQKYYRVDAYANLHTNSAIVGPEAFCFKDGVEMKVYKVVSDLGTNGMGGIQRTWDVWLKCPVCGAKVRDRQTRWVPRPLLGETLAHSTNRVAQTNLFQERKNPARVRAPKERQ